MTIKELNEMNDKDRIKLFLEATMRQLCDDICDDKPASLILEKSIKFMNELSQIYKNMGFDKAGVDK